jgi:hypothetical protein
MIRLFGRKPQKMLPLGRWQTDKAITDSMRLADLANHDSCGTCGIPEYNPPKDKYLTVGDDVIDIGIVPYSFHLYIKKD